MSKLLNRLWYQRHPLRYALLPLAWLFRVLIRLRRQLISRTEPPHVPIIVVGNLTVGGAGKTPLVIYLCELLKRQGYQPGVISRGYGGSSQQACAVTPQSDPREVGDEAVLIAKRTGCPVVVDRHRQRAVDKLLSEYDCTVVISDDGLQHYDLPRTLEIAVIDGLRRFGNGFCLPAGPLREPVSRLQEVDFIVCHGHPEPGEYQMTYSADAVRDCQTNAAVTTLSQPLTAIAGLGNPDKFFNTLNQLGIEFKPKAFPDHHAYQRSDLEPYVPLIMTEKDAVKCQAFAQPGWYYLPITATLEPRFDTALLQKLSLSQHH